MESYDLENESFRHENQSKKKQLLYTLLLSVFISIIFLNQYFSPFSNALSASFDNIQNLQ